MIRFWNRYFLQFKSILIFSIFIFSVVFVSIRYHYDYSSSVQYKFQEATAAHSNNQRPLIIIATVACGLPRIEEALVMIKSALVFQQESQLHFVVFADIVTQQKLHTELRRYQSQIKNNTFSYELRNTSFPKEREREWRRMFAPCSTQRLFFPELLSNMSAIVYVDSDTLFLNKPADIWNCSHKLNSSQMVALATEHEDPKLTWYRFAKAPFYEPLGLNAGVMFMNLTKMREFNFINKVKAIYDKYKSKIRWADQDLLNIMFHYHPDKLYVYPCTYNYRTDHCIHRKSLCKSADTQGVSIMHANRGVFHNKKYILPFQVLYETFRKYELGTDVYENLLEPARFGLKNMTNTYCGVRTNLFIKNLVKFFDKSNPK